jgi:DNA polymerase-3 subunit alpha (Gram-positive type)
VSLLPQYYSEFVSVDLETTGLSPTYNKIIEIGALKIRNEVVVDTFHSLINPNVFIPQKITAITGITNNMVKDSPSIEVVLPKFIKFVGNAPIVAHNSKFDMGFIKHNAKKMGLKLENLVIDTLELARNMFPHLNNHKLNTVAKHLFINLENHHRSMVDSAAAAEIYIKCMKMLG